MFKTFAVNTSTRHRCARLLKMSKAFFFFFNPCAQFCHQAELGAVITAKHRAPCRYSLTTMPAQLLAPVKQQKTIGWSAAASIECAAGRASQADSWEVVCRGKAEGVCRGKVALRDLLEKLRGSGSVGSSAHLAQMLWSKPPRFKAAASAAWTPAEPAFCSAKKKKYDKSWCLSRAVVLQLEDPASCSVERKRLNKRLSCFTGCTGI